MAGREKREKGAWGTSLQIEKSSSILPFDASLLSQERNKQAEKGSTWFKPLDHFRERATIIPYKSFSLKATKKYKHFSSRIAWVVGSLDTTACERFKVENSVCIPFLSIPC